MTVSDLSESELVARIQSRLPPQPDWVVVGIGDDGAVVEPARNRLEVVTTDALIEGVHFDRQFTPPRAVGHRALAVNLSDLAAMGAAPRLAVLSLALPPAFPVGDFDALTGGLAALAARSRIAVVGGNLSRSPGPLIVDVMATGTVKPRQALTRAGARAGDELYVTGTIGTAGAGLRVLRDAAAGSGVRAGAGIEEGALAACIQRFLYPEPRLRAGQQLARNGAVTACLDLSDGLAAGLRSLAHAGGIGIQIEEELLPLGPSRHVFQDRDDPVLTALAAGDDYELLFAVRPRFRGRLKTALTAAGTTATRIGVCVDGRDVVLRRAAAGGRAEVPVPGGFSHFGSAT